jgi:hypothetical protein
MRTIIGFDTPSKAKAQEELNNAQTQNEAPQMNMNLDKLHADTVMRLEHLGNVIMSEQFQEYNEQSKAQILNDFAYYSKVADSI